MKKIIFIVVLNSICLLGVSQTNKSNTRWKKQRKELFFGFGVSNFLGDLGGLNKIGTDYSYADLEYTLTRPSATLGYRYRLSRNFGWRNDFNYMQVSGSDALTKDIYRHNRNLSFKSNIFELSSNLEYAFIFDKQGHKYDIKKTKMRRQKNRNSYIYFSVGVGVFWFNPKALYNGTWHELQKLGTEGQGQLNGTKKYRRISVSIPMAIGVRFIVGKKMTIGLEYNFRTTFTDYIDDVSTTYYDNNVIKQNNGQVAAALADPSLNEIKNATSPNADGTGTQRGDKQKDSYMAIELKFGFFLKQKRKITKLRSKF